MLHLTTFVKAIKPMPDAYGKQAKYEVMPLKTPPSGSKE